MPIHLTEGPRQKCAWPNLTLLPDGEIAAAIWNQPCHGRWEGDVECWVSADGGESWELRGPITAHEPGTNRMNVSAGLDADGALLVACSGWDKRGPAGTDASFSEGARTLDAWVRRSTDGGRSWETIGTLPSIPAPDWSYVPFGDITTAANGDLVTVVYTRFDNGKGGHQFQTRLTRSSDGGATWTEPTMLNELGNETDILHLGDGRWLATSRQDRMWLFTSDDDGHTWTRGEALTLPRQLTGHIMRLADGRILHSSGNRCPNMTGVDVRFSADDGATWGRPCRLIDTPMPDCGYPSTIQRADGRLVTAAYAQQPGEYRYSMPVAIWDADVFQWGVH